jgi:hypothetical protein
MRRATLVVSILALALLGQLAANRSPATSAQDATPMAGQELVGSWRLTVTEAQAPPFLALGTFGADGTVVVSPPPVVPPSPHGPATVVHTSAGHGAWEVTGADTAIVTFVLLATDEQGNLFATRTIRASLTLGSDGQSFSGEFEATVVDPAGNVMATESGVIQATRIIAEAPGTRAATPMVATPAA